MLNYDVAALDAIIERYSNRIEEVGKNELYKWEAAYRFQQHWNPDAADFEAIAKTKPLYAVFRDASMADDATAANFEEPFKTYSPDTIRRVI